MYTIRTIKIPGDLPALAAHASERGMANWTVQHFRTLLATSDIMGIVCTDAANKILGAMLYELKYDHFRIFYLLTGKEYAAASVNQCLLDELRRRCAQVRQGQPSRRNHITCAISETNLNFQKFLQAQGFTARRPTAEDRANGQYHFTWIAEAEALV